MIELKKSIKHDWTIFRLKLFSPIAKKNRIIILVLIGLILGIVFVPLIIPLINGSFKELSNNLTKVFSIPFLLIAMPLLGSFLVEQILYFVWLNEEDKIQKYRTLSNFEIKKKIKSIILLPLIALGIFYVIFYLLVVFLMINCCTPSILPFTSLEAINYFMIVLGASIFWLIWANYNIITQGNFLIFQLEKYMVNKGNLSKKEYKNLKFLKNNHISIKGVAFNLVAYYLVFLWIFPFTLNLGQIGVLKIDEITFLLWTLIWFFIFTGTSIVLWMKIPEKLKNVEEKRYKIKF